MGSKGRPRLAIPLQLLHIGAVLRENAEASTVSRPSVQVEHQMMAAGEPRNLLGSCDGSQVVDSQEISSLRRQHEANASMKPRPLCSTPTAGALPPSIIHVHKCA